MPTPSKTLLALSCAVLTTTASAESASDASAAAKKMADPNANMGLLTFNFDHVSYDGDLLGANDQSAQKISFQPSLPYSLGEGTNLFMRPLIPLLIEQPAPVIGDQNPSVAPDNFNTSELVLGDIGFDVAIGKTVDKNVLIAGVTGTLPTATDDDVGLDQWLLGPEFYYGRNTSFGHMGILVTHQWDIAGEDDYNTSITGGQYFFTYNLENAWQIQMQPTYSYNHNAEKGQELTFPLAIGVAKTEIIGGAPWKFGLQLWHYTDAPDAFGPEYQLRFSVTPVVPLPW